MSPPGPVARKWANVRYDLVAAGRSPPEVAAVTSVIDDRFRDVLAHSLGYTRSEAPGTPSVLDRVWLLVQAVRLEQVRPGSVLTTEQAADTCRALRIGAAIPTSDPVRS